MSQSLKVIILICLLHLIFFLRTVVNIEIGGTTAMPLDQFFTFSLNCTLVVTPELDDVAVELNWADQDLTPFNSTADEDIVLDSLTPMITSANNNTVYTHILKFNGLQPSQVGSYTCGALFGGSTLIRREFSVSIQGNEIIYELILIICHSSSSIGCIQCQYNWSYI